ncbi:hypothetical protein ES708_16736 [subsurface metagenome]
MDCKCGHTKYSHYRGRWNCAVQGCKCPKFKPVEKSECPVYDEKTDEVYRP